MTSPVEIIAGLRAKGLSVPDIAASVASTKGAVQGWASGRATPPSYQVARLERLARSYRLVPPAGLVSMAEMPKGGPT